VVESMVICEKGGCGGEIFTTYNLLLERRFSHSKGMYGKELEFVLLGKFIILEVFSITIKS
jgi:hypothetical protein